MTYFRWLPLLPLVLVAVLLAACNARDLIDRIADPEKVKISRGYFDRLVAGDLQALADELDPSIRSGRELEQLRSLRAMIPAGSPAVTELVGFWIHASNAETRYTVTHQYGYAGKWVVVTTIWIERGSSARVIYGMTVNALDRPLQEIHAFSFQRAGVIHYLFLFGAIGIPAFILVTLVLCVRTKLPRRKWLWIVFLLFGFVQCSLNWTTGETGVQPLYFQLFGAGFVGGGPYGPLIFSISVPVGAIMFWFKRRRLMRESVTGEGRAVPENLPSP